MEDERKSTNSALTASSLEGGRFDVSSKKDSIIFSFLYPLYDKTKQPPTILPMISYCFLFLELVTLSFFSINPITKMPTIIGNALGFVNFASLMSVMKTLYGIVPIALLALLIIFIVALILVSRLYQWLFTHQPWILLVTKIAFLFFFQVLIIPFVNMSISAFDCYRPTPTSDLLNRYSGAVCFGGDDTLNVIGEILAIIFLVLYFVAVAMYHFFIVRSNPKRGGLFAAPSGKFQTCIAVLVMGLVFCQRLLVDWAFWRAVVSVGTAAGIILAVIMMQPFYSRTSNFLVVLLFSVYGTLRLGLEIGFLIDSGTGTIVGTIVFGVVGIGGGIGLSFLFLHLLKVQERRTWGVTITKDNELLPRFDLASEEGKHKLMQHVGRKGVEPTVRFVLVKKLRSRALVEYVDGIYTTAILQWKEDKVLLADYALFLQTVSKNRMKAQVMLQQCKKARPGIATRFLIHCVMKGESAENGSGGGESMELNLKVQLEQAENDREDALEAQIEFYENVSKQKPNFSLLQKQLTQIVKAEASSKKSYEQLLSQHTNDVAVLRSYGVMLQKIMRDDDMADYVLTKADQIEEDTTDVQQGTITGTLRTDPRGETGSHVPIRKKKKKKKKTQVETGIEDMIGVGGSNKSGDIKGIFLLISAGHFIGIAGFIAAYVVTDNVSKNFISALDFIRDVGTIVISGCRLSIIGLQFLIHDFVWDWTKMEDTNKTIDTVTYLLPYFTSYGHKMTDLMKTVYESNVENEVWEYVDIPVATAFFDATTNTTINVTTADRSFLNLVADMAQLSTQIGAMKDVPTEFKEVHSRMISCQYNSYHPLFEGGKRALVAYADNANDASVQMRTLFNLMVALPTAVVLIVMIVSYTFLSVRVTMKRKEILRRSIEVKKSNFQKVTRLLTEDGGDNTTTRMDEEEEDEDNGLEEEEEEDSEEMVEDGVDNERSEHDENCPEMSSTPAQNDTFESSTEPKPLNSNNSSMIFEDQKTFEEDDQQNADDASLPVVPLPRRRLGGRGTDSPYNHSDVYSTGMLPPLNHYNSSPSHSTILYDQQTGAQFSPSLNANVPQFSLNQPPPQFLLNGPTQPPVETKTDFGFGQFTARSLLTQRDEDDDHQTRRDDAEWEEAFENAVEDLIAGHKTIHSGIPIMTKIIMVSHVVLVFGLLVVYIVPNNFSFNSFTDSVDNILLAAIRPICLTNSNFFLLNLAFDMPFLVFPKLITHPTSTNPVWNDSSHLSQDRSYTLKLLSGSLDYFRKTSLITHFGTTTDTLTNDKLIDARTITRFDNDFNIEQLLVPGDCFMTDKASCIAEPIHERLYESHDTLAGLQSLVSRFLQYGEFLKEEDESQFDENHPIFHFMNSALRKDLREGTVSMMERMCKDCGADKDVFMSNLLIFMVVLVVAYFFLQFVMIQPYVTFKRMGLEDRRLDELISFDTDDGNYIRFVDAMKIGNKGIDGQREKMIEAANNVIRMHEQHESAGMQETAMDELMKATKRAFREEEQNMVDRLKAGGKKSKEDRRASKVSVGKTSSLTNEQIDSHKLEHRVMIQRLGIIFDGLRGKNLARQAISVRHLTRLFDRHFITSDVCDLTNG